MSEELTAIRQLSGLPASKSEQKQYAAKLKEELLSGNVNPLQAHIFVKSVLDTIKSVIDDPDVKEYTLEEARKYNEKTFECFGAKCTIVNRPTYDYSGCGDTVYNAMVADMEKMKESMKAREAMLKTGSNPVTGETYQPVKVTNSESITIKIQ